MLLAIAFVDHSCLPLLSNFIIYPLDELLLSYPVPTTYPPAVTVTTQLAETLLSEDLRVIVTVPTPLAVTKPPLEVTVATELLLLVHTVLSVVFDGFIVLLNCKV